jgi:hypothetical protein
MIKTISLFLLLFSVCLAGNTKKEIVIKKWKDSQFTKEETLFRCDFFSAGENKEYSLSRKDPTYILLSIDNSAVRKTDGSATLNSIDFREYSFSTSYGGGRKLPAKEGMIRFSVTNKSSVDTFIIISYKQ